MYSLLSCYADGPPTLPHLPQGTSAEIVEMRKKHIKFFLPGPGLRTLDAGLALRQAKFQARPPDGARLARAELAVETCGRQMAVEAAAPRAVPRQGETGRAGRSQCVPGCPSTSDLAAAASCPRHDPAHAPDFCARRAGPGLGRSGRCLRYWPLPGETVPSMAIPAREAPAAR